MAGVFKTVGSVLGAVDTVAASGARRLQVWAAEAETKTKYRSVSAMMRIKREAATDLAAEIQAMKNSVEIAGFSEAMSILDELDKPEKE